MTLLYKVPHMAPIREQISARGYTRSTFASGKTTGGSVRVTLIVPRLELLKLTWDSV